jgi:hypothetical protein
MRQNVVVLSELQRAIIYTTRMIKQVTNRVTWGSVHSVPYELRCQADIWHGEVECRCFGTVEEINRNERAA